MPIAPLDLQQLYMQQGHIGKMEHARLAVHTLLVQSEDKDINKDSYEKDSTVVRSQETAESDIVKERKESRKQETKFIYYKKKKYKQSDDEAFDTIVEEDGNKYKGKNIDLFG